MDWDAWIEEQGIEEPLLYPTGYQDCIIGIVERFGQPPILCIDKEKLINRYMKDGMSWEEAVEFYEVNTVGAWMGEGTPCFLIRPEDGQG